jgi:D-alanyl-D-alanine carboxypeptidase
LLTVALAAQLLSMPAGATITRPSAGAKSGVRQRRPPDLPTRLQTTLERERKKSFAPGAQAALLVNGKLVWAGTDGLAVKRPRRKVSDETLFYFASFGKMILASFTLHLAEAGRISLDEPIGAYVGESVPGANRVTVRMLLSHTAGYPDIYSQPEVAPLFGRDYDPNRNWTFKLLFKGLRPPHNPGKRWEYSNTGYLILAYVLQQVTSRSLPHAVYDFLAPAGTLHPITESSLTMRRTQKVATKIAHAYVFNRPPPRDIFTGAKLIPTDLLGMPWGDGAFAGTALGAAQFLNALLLDDLLLEPATVEEMITPTEQSLEKKAPYGLGTERIVASKRTWQGHEGAYSGFSSMGFTDLESGVTLVVVANGWGASGGLPANKIWRALVRVYVQNKGTG